MLHPRHARWFAAACCIFTLSLANAQAQRTTPPSASAPAAERLAERYLQILLRRPTTGTALDKVYDYHRDAGSLDQLFQQLQSTDGFSDEAVGQRLFVSGLLHLKAGDVDAAIDDLKSAEAKRGDDPLVAFHLGQAYAQAGRDDEATAALARAAERDPPRTIAADIFLKLGQRYQQKGESEKAEAIWQELDKRFPDDRRIGQRIASTQAAAGALGPAIERMKKLAAAAKASGDAETAIEFSMQAAQWQRRDGATEEALAALQSLLDDTRPGSYLHNDLQRHIESILREASDPAALVDYYQNRLQNHPDDLSAQTRYAEALAGAGRYSQAADIYRQVIARAPGDLDARRGLIAMLRAQGKTSEALQQYGDLIARDPTNVDHYTQWAELTLQNASEPIEERRREAARIWLLLAERRSDDALTLTHAAKRLGAVGQDDDALRLYQRAITLAPDQPEYREYLGEYLFQLGRTDDAIEAWQAIASGPRESLQSLVRLAEVFSSFGLLEPMATAIGRAAEHDPTLSHRLQFASMLASFSRFERALEQLEQAKAMAESPQQHDRVLEVEIDLLVRSGRLPQAIEDAKRDLDETAAAAEKNDPAQDDPFLLRRLALLQQAGGRWLAALDSIERAIQAAPRDVTILTTAATIHEEAFRIEDAIDYLQQLAELDRAARFQHLAKIAQLQLRLGRVEEALETGQRRIVLNPSSAASYEAFAELCFAAARDEEAIEALRRALELAPRNREVRRRLASTLADQYRTDEAIELYWQEYDAATKREDQLELIALLTPLHQRLGQFPAFIDRLTGGSPGGAGASPAETALRVAAAHEAAGDVPGALEHLKQAARGTADARVLQRVVQLASLTEDFENAFDYQRRLLELEQTPEQRQQLLTLSLRSEDPAHRVDAVGRLCRAGEQATVIATIDNVLRRGQFAAVVELADAFLQSTGADGAFPGELRLAVGLCGIEDPQRAARSIEKLRSLLAEGKVVAFLPPQDPVDGNDPAYGAEPTATSPRMLALNLAPQLAALLQLGDPRACPITAPPAGTLDLTQFRQPEQLMHLVETLSLANAAKRGRLEAAYRSLDAEPGESDASAVLEHTDRWTALLRSQAYVTFGGEGVTARSEESTQPVWQRELWKLVEAEDATARAVWLTWLTNRQADRAGDAADRARLDQHRLSDQQLEWLASGAANAVEPLPVETHLAIYHELLWHDRAAAADSYVETVDRLRSPTSLPDLLDAQLFFLESEQARRAAQLTAAIRTYLTEADQLVPPERLDRIAGQALRVGQAADAAVRWETLQLLLATEQRRARQVPLIPSASESTESLMVYRSRDGQSTLQNEVGPVSSRLVRPEFLEAVFELVVNAPGADEAEMKQTADRLRMLTQPQAAAEGGEDASARDAVSAVENLPAIVAFFLSSWAKEWSAADATLDELQARLPHSVDLQLERARLLETQGKREEAISLLVTIRPSDPQTLQKRDLRLLRLASYASKPGIAEEAANRLSVMPLDSATQLTLVGQLKRMGLDQMADEVLQRVRRQAADDARTLLDVAFAYERQGRPDAAAEAAYDVVRRDQRNDAPSAEMIRAVRLLHALDRLEPIVAQLEARSKAAGEPLRLLRQLSKLYEAAGLHDKMLEVESKITEREPGNAKAQAELGSVYVSTHRYSLAVDRFLLAFRIDPNLAGAFWQDFERAVQMSDRAEDVYAGLLEIGVDRLPREVIQALLRFSLSANRAAAADPWGDARRAFYRELLEGQEPVALARILPTIRSRARAETAKLAAAPLRKLFADQQTYSADSPIWNQSPSITEGDFVGALEAILKTLNEDVALRDAVAELIEMRRSEAAAQGMADALLATIEWESGQREAAHDRLGVYLDDDASPLAPGLVWQIAQRWNADPASRSIVDAMDQWLLRQTLPEPWTSFEHGIYRRVVDRRMKQGDQDEARRLLWDGYMRRFPGGPFGREISGREASADEPPGLDEVQLQEASFIADRLRQLQRPVAALRIYRRLLRQLQPQRADFRHQPLLRQDPLAVRKLVDVVDEIAIELSQTEPTGSAIDWLERLVRIDNRQRHSDLLVDVPEPWSDRPVGSSAVELLEKIAAEPNGKPLLKRWQGKLEDAQDPELAPTMRLGLKSLFALAAGDEQVDEIIRRFDLAIEASERQAPDAALQWIIVAQRASDSKDAAVAAAGAALARRLLEQAVAAGADHHAIHLARILAPSASSNSVDQQATLDALSQRLDAVAPRRQLIRSLELETVALLLEFSQTALRAGDLPLSLEAASRALGGGPPLLSSGLASEVTGIDLGPGDLHRRAHAPLRLIERQAAALAEQWLRIVSTTDGEQQADQVERTLATIVFPTEEPKSLQLYLSPTIGTPQASSAHAAQPRSLIAPLATVAATRGTLDAIHRSLDEVASATGTTADIETARMVLAQAAGDYEAAVGIAEQLAVRDAFALPSWQETVQLEPPDSPFTPTLAKKRLAGRKLELADRLLLLLPEAAHHAQLIEDSASKSQHQWVKNRDMLLLRVAAMLLSDQEARRHAAAQLDALLQSIGQRHGEGETAELAEVAERLRTLVAETSETETP